MLELLPDAITLTRPGPTPADWTTPGIAASTVGTVTEDDGVLLWLSHGAMTVRTATAAVAARAGQAMWLPPGTTHSVQLERGSVAVPLFVGNDEARALPDAVAVVDVPTDWSCWLLHRLSRWFGFADAPPGEGPGLAALFNEREAPDHTQHRAEPRLPPRPRSREARLVVQRLLDDPARRLELDEVAAEVHASRRTVQRQLLHETGASFSRWRTAARMSAATTLLAQGRSLGWTAHEVGYAGQSAFHHAFVGWVGETPGQFAARHARASGRGVIAPQAATPSEHRTSAPGPPLPRCAPVSWIPPGDSCLWVYEGRLRVHVAGRVHVLTRGDVVWLQRGITYHLDLAADSVILPLGFLLDAPPGRAAAPHVTTIPTDPATERYLVHLVVAHHFLLRPSHHDDQLALRPFRPHHSPRTSLPAPIATIVSSVLLDPSDQRSLGAWSRQLEVDPLTLGRDFTAYVGEPFTRWRTTVRMSEARTLLWEGNAPSSVARRLGYTQLSAFSRAFSTTHGVPPREWQRRQA